MTSSCFARRRAAAVVLCCLAASPFVRAGDGDAVAIINGRPISRAKLVDTLIDARGLEILQQLMIVELARDAGERENIRVSPEEVRQEYEREVARISPEATASGTTLTDEQKRKALDIVLGEKNISFTEFMLAVERNTWLRKLVEKSLIINPADLKEEFERSYGARVEVRHIQAADLRTIQAARNMLDNGIDFAEVARRLSENPQTAPNGGLMPPFSFNDESIPAVLREAAFNLQPGEISNPVRAGERTHILKLERRIPPENVTFDDKKAEVEQRLRERMIQSEMNRRITDLYNRATVHVLDARLQQQFADFQKRKAAAERK